jgi:hypothetical protein
MLAAADDGIDRTGLDALGAADAVGFDYDCDQRRLVFATAPIERLGRESEHMRQGARAGITTGRAAIDVGIADGHRFGIRPAARVTALAALGLRQYAVEAFGEIGHRFYGRRIGLARYSRLRGNDDFI